MSSRTLRPATEHDVDTLLELMNDFNRSESISCDPVNTVQGFEEPPRMFLTKRLPGAR
jgi:hypothetical protein